LIDVSDYAFFITKAYEAFCLLCLDCLVLYGYVL
jgi:hypothetical protein